ncbi:MULTISPECIES: replication initiator protein A [unclassified Deinococcus]|uniref:replication initiator protein A n=1 Tax=unclassified Deinococcus TaxID=2623546 RepID=UPI0007078384|nr:MULTISPECIES: replication initiator protein A [unclassified Deinococcus]MBX8466560.1 replication initiator protein A [Deinococcus sp. RIT780]MCD0176796.1 replication initiator protein A [Deinococcus sp. 14RED07]
MTRKKRPEKPAPTPLPDVSRIEEANVSRLGLISIQERVPDSFSSWTVDFKVDGRPARLTCDAMPKYGGVPHGLDGDIATALIDLYVETGCPADGLLNTSAYQILKRAGLDDSGRYYQNLRQTLFRLRTATYTASEAWRDHRRGNWTTVTFNYLEGLEFTSGDEDLGLSRSSTLKIRLAEPIVRSIRSQYTKPLDLEFLTSLDRPLTRALYRLLDARRYPPEDPTVPLPSFTVNLMDWAEACKIVDQRSNKIRATLQGAHEELMERRYLSGVEYEGRGRTQKLTYRFAGTGEAQPDQPAAALALTEELRRHRVSLAVAQRLIEEFGEAHVQARLEKFQRLITAGYRVRSRSALLVDVIRDQEGKYPDGPYPGGAATTPAANAPVGDAKGAGRASYMPTLAEAMDEPQPLEAQVDSALKTLQFLLRERLSVSEYALLRMGLIVGRPDPLEATRAASKAKVDGTLDAYTADLLLLLGELRAQV